ncbi:unnamed protein product [Microthlaspi erraticum]|uniref:Uncharacterized protein n=1 Tax=Microthlaspi erraticum TaxID=1685480 RepID=A0A6D2LI54_9BRAS|nr:unnamed protein product [Microthlaspi erraticum]
MPHLSQASLQCRQGSAFQEYAGEYVCFFPGWMLSIYPVRSHRSSRVFRHMDIGTFDMSDYTYSETLGKWHIADLAFGINYLMHRQDGLVDYSTCGKMSSHACNLKDWCSCRFVITLINIKLHHLWNTRRPQQRIHSIMEALKQKERDEKAIESRKKRVRRKEIVNAKKTGY